jgi:hypothetical protein
MIDDSVRCSLGKLRLGGFRTANSFIARFVAEYRHVARRYSARPKLFSDWAGLWPMRGNVGAGPTDVLLSDLCKYGSCAANSGFVSGSRQSWAAWDSGECGL